MSPKDNTNFGRKINLKSYYFFVVCRQTPSHRPGIDTHAMIDEFTHFESMRGRIMPIFNLLESFIDNVCKD